MYKKIVLLLLVFIPSLAKSQNNFHYNEAVFLNYNSSNYLVGETIYYKLYSLNTSNNLLSDLSKIAYVEIIDEDKNSISKQKILLQNGVANGDVFLPVNLKTGIYKIIAYTSYMINQNISSFFIEDIAIINPYQSLLSSVTESSESSFIPISKNISSEYVDIKLSKNNFSTRELVTIKINSKINTVKTNLSLSIRKIDAFSGSNNNNAKDFKFNENIKNSLIYYKIPEIRGEIISGNITAINNTFSIENKTIALSLPGENFATKLVRTNKKGEFNFIVDPIPNKNNVIIQVMEDDRVNYQIQLVEKNIDYSTLNFSKKVKITPEIKKIIENRSIANQIENAYFSIKKDTIKEETKNNAFYHPNEKIIKLDDYTRFPTLKETIIEILPEVFFKKRDSTYSINIRSNVNDIVGTGATLTLIDGLVIQNAEELFEYDTRNMDRVEFVNKKYAYGTKVFNGIINFITKNYNYELKEKGNFILKTEIQRPLNKKYYYNQNYLDVSKYERIPDYRHQLLWMPEVDLNKTISFYTSDITGQFEINIKGFTEDGKPISIKEYFEVN